jgi:hypothetical protein
MTTGTHALAASAADQPYSLFFRTLLGEASEAEIEDRYVALARMILHEEQGRKTDA